MGRKLLWDKTRFYEIIAVWNYCFWRRSFLWWKSVAHINREHVSTQLVSNCFHGASGEFLILYQHEYDTFLFWIFHKLNVHINDIRLFSWLHLLLHDSTPEWFITKYFLLNIDHAYESMFVDVVYHIHIPGTDAKE
jgi:hypothetical protein